MPALTAIFVFCAAVGGTIMVCQLVLSLVGLAGDSLHVDVSSDVGHDFGGDLHGGDFHGGDLHDADAQTAHDVAGTDAHAEQAAAHGSSSLFAMISFRTVVAAMAFFGLAGLAADGAELPAPAVLIVAVAAGLAAMYGVYWVMQLLYRLRSEGNVHVEHALGLPATVYLRVPPERSGVGKIQINLQNRTMEYAAVTAGPELPTGATVVVVHLVAPDTLEVRAVPEPERTMS